MPRDERAAVRQKERSKLVITGVDARGLAFEERTEALAISEDGLAFHLGHSVWMNSHLTAEVASNSIFASSRVIRAMVMRIQADPSGKQFVAVRFYE
jgi:hypothetical protein